MSSRKKEFERKAGTALFNMAERSIVRRTPERAERLGERLGLLLYRLDKKHRTRTHANLAMAMPELSEARRTEIAEGVFRHFGRVAADFMRAEVRTPEEVLQSIEVEGREHFDAAVAQGKGAFLITGHFGNWERMAHWLTLNGYGLTVVARDANDTGLNLRVNQKRAAQGAEVLSRGNTIRGILNRLKEGNLIGILPDQNAQEAIVPFFGKPAGTVLGPGVLHLRTGAPLLPAYCARIGPNKYKVWAEPAVELPESERTPENYMLALNQVLERAIRRYPEQWLWMHDRWKEARKRGLL